jgi:competence protein ComFB
VKLLINLMEEVVSSLVDEVIQKADMCGCDRCRLDVMAVSLNHLPPRYVVSDKGKAFSKADFLDMQNNVSVLRELTRAAEVVRSHPRH